MFLGDVANQFLDEHRLADARAAEQADFTPLGERGQKIDGLQSGLELFRGRHLLLERRREAVNRQPHLGVHRTFAIDHVAQQVEDAPQRRRANGDGDRPAGVDSFHPAHEALRLAHRHGANGVVTKMAGDLAGEVNAVFFVINGDRVVNRRQMFREKLDVHHRSDDLCDLARLMFACAHDAVISCVKLFLLRQCVRAGHDFQQRRGDR